MSLMQQPSHSVLGASGMTTSIVPTNTTLSAGALPAQPVLGLHSSLASSPLTNQVAVSSIPQPLPSLNSSFSPATGISPLRPVSPVQPWSPVTPGLGAAASGHVQLTAPPSYYQPLTGVPASSLASPSMMQPSLLPPAPMRRVLLQPATPSQLATPTLAASSALPTQNRLLFTAPQHQHQPLTHAFPLQPTLQPAIQPALQPALHGQPVLVYQQPQLIQPTHLTPTVLPPHPPTFLQARPLYQHMPQPVGQQPVLVQSLPIAAPQNIQMAPSPQYLTMAPSAPLVVSNPPLPQTGTMFVGNQGII